MDKSYNTTYTTPRISQINGITYTPNYDNTDLVTGVVNMTCNFGNINGIRYNIPQISPSGLLSIPNKDMKSIVQNMGIGQSQYAVIGYMYNDVNHRNKITNMGETCVFSNNYFINLLNNALKISYSSTNPQEAQLPIGEATQQIFKDILNEILNTLKPYINNQIAQNFNTFSSTFNAHTHFIPGAMGGGGGLNTSATTSTAPTITNYAPSAPIQTDYNYVNDGKLLISENGQTII